MRRRQLIGWIVVGGLAASSCSAGASSALPEEPLIPLKGSLVVHPDPWQGCGPPADPDGVWSMLERQDELVQARLDEGKSRVVEIRDAAGRLVASAATGAESTVRRFSDSSCEAVTRFATRIPRRESYTFDVRGIDGASDPISFDDLETLGFECELRAAGFELAQVEFPSCIRGDYMLGSPTFPPQPRS